MSSHVHLILGRNSEQSLQGIIRDIKKFTSVKITEAIYNNDRESRRRWLLGFIARAGERNPNNLYNQFWQQHSRPIELNTHSITYQKSGLHSQ